MHPIDLTFLAFPTVCLLYSYYRPKNRFLSAAVITFIFLLFFSWSGNGADYNSYRVLFEEVRSKSSVFVWHGEIGYNFCVLLAVKLGIPYHLFRILILTISTLVLFRIFYKWSPDFYLSVFFAFSLFLIYMISAYRQFIVISFSFYWLDKFFEGKKKQALIGMLPLVLFHIIAVIPLAFLLAAFFFSDEKIEKFSQYLAGHIIPVLFFAVIFRVVFCFIYRLDFVKKILSVLSRGYSNAGTSLVSFGLFSRTFYLVIISILYYFHKEKNKNLELLYASFAVAMLLYIMVPFELIMGRIMTTQYFYIAVLIPMLSVGKTEFVLPKKAPKIKNLDKIFFLASITVAFAVLLSQLLRQSGYYPYEFVMFRHLWRV